MRFILDNPNDSIQQFLFNGQFFEQKELEIMNQYCPPKAHILDIGANIGNHTIYFSKFFSAEVIYPIEPVRRSYTMLLANLALNYCHNVNVDYVGVAFGHTDTTGYPLQTLSNNLGSTRLAVTPEDYKAFADSNPGWDGVTYEPVKVIRGDDIFADMRIDFIKMDIEGMEIVALEGLKECIDKNRPNMFIEVSVGNEKEFHEWVKANNYKIVWEDIEPNIFCNYIVIPESKDGKNTDMWSSYFG